MAIVTTGTSVYGIVAAGCRLLPGVKLGFDRGMHIASIAEVVVGGGARGWRLVMDNDLPEGFESYLPQCSNLGAASGNGESPASVLVVPYTHRLTTGPGAPLQYLVFLRTTLATSAEASAWPAYLALVADPTDNPPGPGGVLPGDPVSFPQLVITEGGLVATSPSAVHIPADGTYKIDVQLVASGPGEILVAVQVGGAGPWVELPETHVARDSVSATGPDNVDTHLVMSVTLALSAGDFIRIQNPAGAASLVIPQVPASHGTLRVTLDPLPAGPPAPPLAIGFVDPTVANVGSEGFSWILVQTGKDSAVAPLGDPSMSEPVSAYGIVLAACLLNDTAYSKGLHIRGVAAVDLGGGNHGWRVTTPLHVNAIATVGLVSLPGDDTGAPTHIPRVVPFASVSENVWDVYLVNATTGALVDLSDLAAASFVSLVVTSSDGETGAVT